MEEPFDLSRDKIRIRSKCLSLLFDNHKEKKNIYDYYLQHKVGENPITIYVSYDSIFHNIPNTTVVIDYGIPTDKQGIKRLQYQGVIPVIRKIQPENFRDIVNKLRADPDIYPSISRTPKVDITGSPSKHSNGNLTSVKYDLAPEPIKAFNTICRECKIEKANDLIVKNGIICKLCKDVKIKENKEKKTIEYKIKELDPDGSFGTLFNLYMESKELSLNSRIRKLELDNSKYKQNLEVLAK
jgi:hypothetical protein